MIAILVKWWQSLPWSSSSAVLLCGVLVSISVVAIILFSERNEPLRHEVRAMMRRDRDEARRNRKLKKWRKKLQARVIADRNYSEGQFSVGRDVKNLFTR